MMMVMVGRPDILKIHTLLCRMSCTTEMVLMKKR